MVGVPARVAVPLPLSVKVTPGGTSSQPKLGAGYPVVVTVKVPAVPDREGRGVGAGDRRGLADDDVKVWVASG